MTAHLQTGYGVGGPTWASKLICSPDLPCFRGSRLPITVVLGHVYK